MHYWPLGPGNPPDWDSVVCGWSTGRTGLHGELWSEHLPSTGHGGPGPARGTLCASPRLYQPHLPVQAMPWGPGLRRGQPPSPGVSGLCPAGLRQALSAMLRGGALVGAVSHTGHPELPSSCPVRGPLTCVCVCCGEGGACVSLLRWEF